MNDSPSSAARLRFASEPRPESSPTFSPARIASFIQ